MVGVYALLLFITVGRRLSGETVLSDNPLFLSMAGAYSIGLAYQTFCFLQLRVANRTATLISRRRLDVTLLVEFAVPAVILIAAHYWSPRGQYAALSPPTLLLFPLTVLVSVLRLRPRATLGLGLAAGVLHIFLTINTYRNGNAQVGHLPVLFTYGLTLFIMALAGMLVTGAARRYVIESIEEAEALYTASQQLAGVKRDLDIARDIQNGLLPTEPPNFPGYDFAGMNIPAEQTGGDYYDWQELPDGKLLIAMADVTGHGIGPALVMAICRAYARATAPLEANLGTFLGRLNSLLCSDLRGARFITLAVALLDSSGRLELLSAGHGPSMLFQSRTKTVEQFGGDGLPLAIMAEETYGPIRKLNLDNGDVLVLFTDGLFEWCNPAGEQFGTTRTAETIARSAHKPAAAIMKDLHTTVLNFVGASRQNDDLTIVVVKRK